MPTTFNAGSMNQADHQPSTDHPAIDETLGWEGHVNLPPSPMLTTLLRHVSDLQTSLAFGMAFVVGVLVGGVLFTALGSGKKRSDT